MTSADWRAAADVDLKSLGEARTQAQNAVHWLARLANSYVPAEPDQRHVWLTFDAARRAFVTQPFAGSVSLELRLPSLELQFRENDSPVPHILHVEGHSPAKVEAWVLVDVTTGMKLAREEIFGPVAPLFRFQTEDEAVRMANDTEFGLAAYFFSRDHGRCWRVGARLEAGIIGINTGLISTAVAPFGGVKQSGQGREGSRHGADDYLQLKYLCMGGLE